MNHDRRLFLEFMGRTAMAASLASLVGTACTTQEKLTKNQKLPFSPLSPSSDDQLLTAKGFQYSVLIKYNDPLSEQLRFGSHCDFLHFTPLNSDNSEGILWSNHEYLHPVLVHNRKMDTPRTKSEMALEQTTVGGSLVHLQKKNNQWSYVPRSHWNRRIDGTTRIPFANNTKIMGKNYAIGSLTNCGGGFTPWNTVLTCEENYDIFYGDVEFRNKKRTFIKTDKMNWYEHYNNPPEHYGWVVEVNPLTGKAQKHTALGRFEHEGAAVIKSKSGKVVVYMGEDRKGGGIYKFVSASGTSLLRGTLFVANTEKGQWIPLDITKHKSLQEHFNTQLEVLTYAREASQIVGYTPQDRPEDIEIDPKSGAIIVALTNNDLTNNTHGGLLRIEETDGDYESMTFSSKTFLSGGPDSGFSCPDNLAFDKNGNLWMTTDMAEYDIRDGKFKGRGNNGLFYIPMSGENAGHAFQVASAPVDAELTGPTFSPDYKTLFLSVQHPGADTKDPQHPTSLWPENTPGVLPKSSVVAVQGSALDQLMSPR